MQRVPIAAAALAAILFAPALAFAQATVAGVVRDLSGGLLPGVSVEASSPVLIEKTRTVLSDGSGQYRITDLPPGTYVLTFSLQGFTTVKRDGVAVSGSGVTGVEFVHMFRSFGSEVTLIVSRQQVLPQKDAEVAAALEDDFLRRDVKLLKGARAEGIDQYAEIGGGCRQRQAQY